MKVVFAICGRFHSAIATNTEHTPIHPMNGPINPADPPPNGAAFARPCGRVGSQGVVMPPCATYPRMKPALKLALATGSLAGVRCC